MKETAKVNIVSEFRCNCGYIIELQHTEIMYEALMKSKNEKAFMCCPQCDVGYTIEPDVYHKDLRFRRLFETEVKIRTDKLIADIEKYFPEDKKSGAKVLVETYGDAIIRDIKGKYATCPYCGCVEEFLGFECHHCEYDVFKMDGEEITTLVANDKSTTYQINKDNKGYYWMEIWFVGKGWDYEEIDLEEGQTINEWIADYIDSEDVFMPSNQELDDIWEKATE